MKLITFVVPCYNSMDYMRGCIDSLLPARECCEIIIIDDGSADRTGEIADEYAREYPDCVRVVHQPNGGHGEGINQGLCLATGKYFKVIDSDDHVDGEARDRVLSALQSYESFGGVDLLVCNYVYENQKTGYRKVIRFGNAIPEGRILSWKETHPFRISQQLSLHSCIYRTETVRKTGLVLPKHVFYEDNLFVYTPLPYVETLAYINADFYRYAVGRDGQSVEVAGLIRHCGDQRTVAKLIFAAHDIDEVRKREPKLGRYLHHSMSFMLILAVVFTRLQNTRESDLQVKQFWDDLIAIDPKKGKKMRYFSRAGSVLSLPGYPGRQITRFFYWVSHLIVRFN